MKKEELVEVLESLDIVMNEGIQNDSRQNIYPRLVFFENLWNEIEASGSSFETVVTYQISFFAQRPRDPKLLELRHKLNDAGLKPQIFHEYVEDLNCVHSYMAVDVVEAIS